ncbi:hypothetical protein [Streptomyces sp. NPDC057682]|uniref:hypothetical protein n=1 Tax=Streptomyces sp. NPDC057682 TaxID=3346210 RepID=UPI0036A1D9D0
MLGCGEEVVAVHDGGDLLQDLGVDPADLDPAPARPVPECVYTGRLVARYPCVRCGDPATVAAIAETPLGRRWVDRCMPCLVATTPRGGPPGPLEDTMAVLREAAATVGVALTVVTDEA